MPSLNPIEEKNYLRTCIERLVSVFGRDAEFTVNDLYTVGGTERRVIGDDVFLPPEHVPEYLKELELRGLVETRTVNNAFCFKVTQNYEGLIDRVTPQDIHREKMNLVDDKLKSFAPHAGEKLVQAEKRLTHIAGSSDASEIGNLCIQCFEELGDALWNNMFTDRSPRPSKSRIKDRLSPVFKEVIPSKSSGALADSLWELFDETRNLIEKLKHRQVDELSIMLSWRSCSLLLFVRK